MRNRYTSGRISFSSAPPASLKPCEKPNSGPSWEWKEVNGNIGTNSFEVVPLIVTVFPLS